MSRNFNKRYIVYRRNCSDRRLSNFIDPRAPIVPIWYARKKYLPYRVFAPLWIATICFIGGFPSELNFIERGCVSIAADYDSLLGISTSGFCRWTFDTSIKPGRNSQTAAYDRKLCLRDRVKYMNQSPRTCRTYGMLHVFVMTWLALWFTLRIKRLAE